MQPLSKKQGTGSITVFWPMNSTPSGSCDNQNWITYKRMRKPEEGDHCARRERGSEAERKATN